MSRAGAGPSRSADGGGPHPRAAAGNLGRIVTTPRRVAILSGGHIADITHLPARARRRNRGSRDLPKAQQLANQHGVPHAFADPTELYRTGQVDAVVIASPNYLHNPLAI